MRPRVFLVAACAAALLVPPCAAAASLEVPAQLRLVNYYPAHAGWTYMWERWDPRAIDADFARIAGLNANTVRVIVQTNTFGYPQPSQLYADRLAEVVRLAAAHGLRVELTLFDWWHDYWDIGSSQQWVAALLAPYAGDERIAAIELQNELDPGDPLAVAWARALLPFVRSAGGGIPVTISVPGTNAVARLQSLRQQLAGTLPDFWSVHYYDRPELAYAELAAAKAAVAPQPLFVGETGYAPPMSFASVQTRSDRDDEQVRFLRTVQAAASALGLPAIAPWILSDLAPDASPDPIAATEYRFGLFRQDGTPKPAAAEVRALFGGRAAAGFDGGFEQEQADLTPAQPALWRRAGDGDFARDPTVAHSGEASVTIAAGGSTPTSHARLTTAAARPWLLPGETATLSVWARGESATGQTVASLRFHASDGSVLGSASSAPLLPGTTPWTLLTLSVPPPPGAVYARIVLRSNLNSGRVWFDDVSFAAGS